jgi:hypothetical protein
MCYQVVERYSVCRCLYYKHAIDHCAAHGERGHATQQKTVLVGYACSTHWSRDQDVGVVDIVDNVSDLDDSSDDGESMFSTSIALSRCTSFITSEGDDTITEVLDVLLEDPQLHWEKLVRSQTASPDGTQIKDVQFFLGAFERDLRAEADSTIQFHACAFLRGRVRYFSSKIYERFNPGGGFNSGIFLADEENASGSLQYLQLIDMDEPDPTLMPAFPMIREFLFNGTAYEALKENVRNFSKHTRNYEEELVDILLRNIHPPTASLAHSLEQDATRLRKLLDVFLTDLAVEARLRMLSASDRVGIRSVRGKLLQLSARVNALWTREVPSWHSYPLIPGGSSCVSASTSPANNTDTKGEVDTFETFVCSSKAFWCLARSCAPYSHKNFSEPSHDLPLKLREMQITKDRLFSSPCNVEIKFGCVSFHSIRLSSHARD